MYKGTSHKTWGEWDPKGNLHTTKPVDDYVY